MVAPSPAPTQPVETTAPTYTPLPSEPAPAPTASSPAPSPTSTATSSPVPTTSATATPVPSIGPTTPTDSATTQVVVPGDGAGTSVSGVTGNGAGSQQVTRKGVAPAVTGPDTQGVNQLPGSPEIGVEAAASGESQQSVSHGAPAWLGPVYLGVLIAGAIGVAAWFLIVYLRTRKPSPKG